MNKKYNFIIKIIILQYFSQLLMYMYKYSLKLYVAVFINLFEVATQLRSKQFFNAVGICENPVTVRMAKQSGTTEL